MRTITTAFSFSALLLFVGALLPAQAVVINNTTAGAAVGGASGLDNFTDVDVQNGTNTASATGSIAGVSADAEATALGALKSSTSVSDAGILGLSVAGWTSTLATVGLPPGPGGIGVDLGILIDGSLSITDPTGPAFSHRTSASLLPLRRPWDPSPRTSKS